MRKKKILFIVHHVSIYGAYKSAFELFSNLEDCVIDVAIPKRLLRLHEVVKRKEFFDKHDEREIRSDFNGKIRTMFHISMLRDWWCNVISDNVKRDGSIYAKTTKFLAFLDFLWLRVIVFCNDYDIILVNSTVLHFDVGLSFRTPVSMHVREEIATSPGKSFLRSWKRLKGAVFIDHSTKSLAPPALKTKKKVILNPFDMVGVDSASPHPLPYHNDHFTTIAYVGRMDKIKGYDFIINSFMKSSNQSLRLLLVGSASAEASDFAKACCLKDDRISFMEEIKEFNSVYRVSDFTIRGEEYLSLGRTVYESLFSGVPIIIPHNGEELAEHFIKFDEFKDIVFPYAARNQRSLASLLDGLEKPKSRQSHPRGNISEHVSSIRKFWDSL